MADPTAAITSIIRTHFTTYQNENVPSKRSSTATVALSPSSLRTAAALRDELSQYSLAAGLTDLSLDSNDEHSFDVNYVITKNVLHVIDCAMCALHDNKEAWESTRSILELACALASSSKELGMAVIHRAIDYVAVAKDLVRMEAIDMLAFCVGQFVVNARGRNASILKRGGQQRQNGVEMEDWKVECAVGAGKALLLRLTDKITKVRGAAMAGCVYLFEYSSSEELNEITHQMKEKLSWLASNDTSAANRALAMSCLPVTEDNIADVVVRLKDVDVKVREAALEALRENVGLDDLEEEMMVEILKNGLTKRCPTTHAKTVELLICNWLKSLKYDPISLLDKLNPVINESECEKAIKVILNVASAIDCENRDMSIELIQKHFGAPEIRSFQQIVMKKMSIVQEEEEELTPSLVFFLRVKCAFTVETAVSASSRAETISDVIYDIPTLCNILNGHLDKLIEFNKLDDDELEVDEEEAAAFEDDQNFICLQLIHMAKASELQEEGSRRHFNSIMRNMLSRLETPDDLVDACVKAMATAHDTEAQFVQTISEVLVDVEDDDSFGTGQGSNEKAKAIVRQMRVIAILSIVLENISSHMVGHPILDGFFEHLSPAITSKNAVVREHGVICLSKFCLLSEQDKVMDQFRPLLMCIASSADERAEVRVQAAMALCDLALIHDDMLNPTDAEVEAESTSFKDLLIEMLSHPKPLVVAIAAEISAKLLLAGRFHDPILIGWLVAVYFDSNPIDSESEEENGADGIGSSVRVQQLLSIFFPTYSMSSLDANDAMMASIGPLLEIVNFKMEGMKQKKALEQWPISKMVDFICYIVDIADKTKKSEESVKVEADENDVQPPEICSLVEGVISEEKEKSIVEASSTLLASIDIAEYLAEFSCQIPAFYTRAVAKILGSASIDVSNEDNALLKRLKTQVAEAEYSIDDNASLTAIRKLSKLLEAVDDKADEGEASESDKEVEEEIAETLERTTLTDVEKENPRLSTGTVGSQISSKSRGRESTSSRVSLGSVN